MCAMPTATWWSWPRRLGDRSGRPQLSRRPWRRPRPAGRRDPRARSSRADSARSRSRGVPSSAILRARTRAPSGAPAARRVCAAGFASAAAGSPCGGRLLEPRPAPRRCRQPPARARRPPRSRRSSDRRPAPAPAAAASAGSGVPRLHRARPQRGQVLLQPGHRRPHAVRQLVEPALQLVGALGETPGRLASRRRVGLGLGADRGCVLAGRRLQRRSRSAPQPRRSPAPARRRPPPRTSRLLIPLAPPSRGEA